LEVPFLSFFPKLIVLELPLFFLDYGLLKRIQNKAAALSHCLLCGKLNGSARLVQLARRENKRGSLMFSKDWSVQ